ncbi:MAG: glycosyltransferase [Thermoanaerobacteraceae bacterium]|nr:glycosyltransferase [Thermoanaerobacteraceae bacterium]
MTRLSQIYDVLYVDPPFPVSAQQVARELGEGQKSIGQRLRMMSNTLYVFSPREISRASYPKMNKEQLRKLNLDLLKLELRKVFAATNINNPLLWIYNPAAVGVIGQLGETSVVYDCVDSFHSFSWSSPETEQWEKELVEKADVVLTTSQGLYNEQGKKNRATYLVPNAADYQHFATVDSMYRNDNAVPRDLQGIGKPRLGFVGAVYEWLDFELLDMIAKKHPAWNIVLIGPKQGGLQVPKRKNIYWLGSRQYSELPFYMQHFDVMLIPWLRYEVTEQANPIKMWEYLAVGKPVVATALPEILHVPGVIWMAQDHLEFERHIATVLNLVCDDRKRQEIAEKAQNIARINSWESRCHQIREILKHHFDM